MNVMFEPQDNAVDPQLNGGDMGDFLDTTMLTLTLRGTDFVIIGKAMMLNSDDADQNAFMVLRSPKGTLTLDRTDVRILGNGATCVTVQAVYHSDGQDEVVLSGGTFNGGYRNASLIAMSIDFFN